MSKKEYDGKCFSPNWIEIDLEEAGCQTKEEECLESRNRKNLKTLLKELDEIRQSIERAAEKQHRLANLLNFYNGKLLN